MATTPGLPTSPRPCLAIGILCCVLLSVSNPDPWVLDGAAISHAGNRAGHALVVSEDRTGEETATSTDDSICLSAWPSTPANACASTMAMTRTTTTTASPSATNATAAAATRTTTTATTATTTTVTTVTTTTTTTSNKYKHSCRYCYYCYYYYYHHHYHYHFHKHLHCHYLLSTNSIVGLSSSWSQPSPSSS